MSLGTFLPLAEEEPAGQAAAGTSSIPSPPLQPLLNYKTPPPVPTSIPREVSIKCFVHSLVIRLQGASNEIAVLDTLSTEFLIEHACELLEVRPCHPRPARR
jgi:hypothetical protein